MANVKFTEFPSATTVGSTDIIPIVQGGTNKKATAAVFSTYIGSAFVALTGNQTIAGVKTFSSQLASSVATGTAPFSIASTTKVTNLNADLLDGYTSADFQLALTNPITGTGTTNYLPKFTGTSALGDSNLVSGTNGQLGLGVIPSAWDSTLVRAIQIGNLGGSISSYTALNTSTPYMFVDNNAYFDGTSDKYILNRAAARYVQVANEHQWFNAPSGTAGNAISFTQAMTLTAGGNLNVIGSITTTNGGVNYGGANTYVFGDNSDLYLGTSGNSRIKITSAGNVGIGTTSPDVFGRGYSGTILGISSAGQSAFQLNSATGNGAYFDMGVAGTRTFSIYSDATSTDIAAIGNRSLGLSTNGNNRIFISGNGNVGVNTNGVDAGYKLDVNGTARVVGTLTGAGGNFSSVITAGGFVSQGIPNGMVIVGPTGSPAYGVTDQSVNNSGKRWRFGQTGAIGGFGSFDFYNQTDNITALTLASSGEATFSGIGGTSNGSINIESTDPTLRFRVTGGTANKRIYEWRAIAAGGPYDYLQLRLWNDAQSSATELLGIASTGAATFSSSVTATTQGTSDGFNTGGIIVKSNGDNAKYTHIGYDNASNFGWIQSIQQGVAYTNLSLNPSGGNVGIGTTSPTTKLQVSGGHFTVDSGYGIGWGDRSSQIYGVSGASGHIRFETNDLERMRIFSNGNIGINTAGTDAGYKLDVNGTGRFASTLYVSNTNGTGIVNAYSAASVGTYIAKSYSATANFVTTGVSYPRGLGYGAIVGAGNTTNIPVKNSAWLNSFGGNIGFWSDVHYGVETGTNAVGYNAVIRGSGDSTSFGYFADLSGATGAERYGIYTKGEAKNYFSGNVGVGTANPDASALMQIDSNTQGFLVPRMLESEINSISSPAEGLMVYNTDQHHMCMYDGSVWKKFSMSNM